MPTAISPASGSRFSLTRGLGFVVLVAAFCVGTVFVDWAIVPVIASVFALLKRDRGVTKEVGAAASLAWLLLIWRQMPHPAFSKLLATLGDIFPVPGIALIAISLILAAILATSAARLSLGIVGVRDERESRVTG